MDPNMLIAVLAVPIFLFGCIVGAIAASGAVNKRAKSDPAVAWGKMQVAANVLPGAKPTATVAPGQQDELLVKQGDFYVPYNPPRYVDPGVSPVKATWDATLATGIQHHTRRVGQ